MDLLPSSLPMLSATLAALRDQDLLNEVERLAGDERNGTARLVASLAEVDRRQLYRDAGCSSLFTYCTSVLKLSEHAAYLRMEAARAVRKFPLILERLAEGTLTLTAVSMLAKHLTPENHRKLLDEARHRSKRELETLVARIHPRPDLPSSVRRLPSPRGVMPNPPAGADDGAMDAPNGNGSLLPAEGEAFALARGEDNTCKSHSQEGARAALPLPEHEACGRPSPEKHDPQALAEVSDRSSARAPAASTPRSVVSELAPARYKVQMTIGAETHAKLRRVQDLLRHVIPNGDPAQIFDRAISLLLADLERTRLAATPHPRAPRRPAAATEPAAAACRAIPASRAAAPRSTARTTWPTPPPPSGTTSSWAGSRHIPAAVKRAVWARDEGRCTFVGKNGRCKERGLLEFHHRIPYAAGGRATVENLEIRCRPHNMLEADRYFRRPSSKNTLDPNGHGNLATHQLGPDRAGSLRHDHRSAAAPSRLEPRTG